MSAVVGRAEATGFMAWGGNRKSNLEVRNMTLHKKKRNEAVVRCRASKEGMYIYICIWQTLDLPPQRGGAQRYT